MPSNKRTMQWFLMHVEEIKLYNVIRFHQISFTVMEIIMVKKATKILNLLYFADLREVKITLLYVRLLRRE